MAEYDVIVVGAGNAAMCAALAAREQGCRVSALERAPVEERGGNSAFTAGAIRVAYNGVEDLLELMPDLSEEERRNTDFGTYSEDQFFDDMARVTQHRASPDLVELLIGAATRPSSGCGRRVCVSCPSTAARPSRSTANSSSGAGSPSRRGVGVLVWSTPSTRPPRANGIEVRYESRALSLLADDAGVRGVRIKTKGVTQELGAKAVILACGGFEANAHWRTRYLGPNWDLAKVRGTRFNTGDGIRMALEIGAQSCGNWSGCHAVGWDRNAPEFGDLAVGDGFQKHSYPFGIMVNARGLRFVDEGADFRNYTYAKYGRVILEQPGQFAWQIFDQKVVHLLRDEYRIRRVTKAQADTLEELAGKLEDVDAERFLATVKEYNAAVDQAVPFNPNVKDGRAAKGLAVPKSNWANTIERPPFLAFAVTCGITFTFGGLRITTGGQVVDTEGQPIPGPLCRGRARRRPLLLQLPRRHRPHVGCRFRQDRRHLGGGCGKRRK